MIVSAILSMLSLLLLGVAFVLPDVDVMPWADWAEDAEDLSHALGVGAGPLDNWLPLAESFMLLDWWLTVYGPVVFTYVTVRWVYAHLPVIGKG